ncbi:MAG: flagellar basal body P-ring protein FlgI [Phycisphaerae bacterium]|nr:flagellar basal body P-ring protein FlgI [Phycisphaerae bacterium]
MRRIACILILLAVASTARTERVKDIVAIKGERGNHLWGYGLVIGLNGTGDNSEVSKRALASVLRRNNMALSPDDIDAENIASVIVTAELGPFNRRGSKLDVKVSCIGNASSLRGGQLLMTPLVAADGQTYAHAQGSLVLGGFGATGDNASVTKGHLTAGSIPNGATVEREELATVIENSEITLLLANPDHATAERIAETVNALAADDRPAEAPDDLEPAPPTEIATAVDAGTVRIRLPDGINKKNITAFIDRIGHLKVEVDQPARVVIDEKTGTIVVGQNVVISTVAITHGNLTVTVEEKNYVVQPSGIDNDGATTQQENRTSVKATEKRVNLHVIPRTITVTELANAINAMGLTPSDMISIFRAIDRAGALQAKLQVE